MHKSVLVIERIKTPEGYEQFLQQEIIGYILQIKGLIRIQLTHLTPVIAPVPDNLTDVRMMIECYFSSIQDVEALLDDPVGIAFFQTLADNSYCEIVSYFGHEHNLMPKNLLKQGSN